MSRWVWAPTEEGSWSEPFAMREEAEEHGRTVGREESELEAGDFGYVAEVEEIEPADYACVASDADSILESMDVQGDIPYAFDEPVFELKPGGREALAEALSVWAKEYVSNGGHYLIGIAQKVGPKQ